MDSARNDPDNPNNLNKHSNPVKHTLIINDISHLNDPNNSNSFSIFRALISNETNSCNQSSRNNNTDP